MTSIDNKKIYSLLKKNQPNSIIFYFASTYEEDINSFIKCDTVEEMKKYIFTIDLDCADEPEVDVENLQVTLDFGCKYGVTTFTFFDKESFQSFLPMKEIERMEIERMEIERKEIERIEIERKEREMERRKIREYIPDWTVIMANMTQ